jgi:hypothetical protein
MVVAGPHRTNAESFSLDAQFHHLLWTGVTFKNNVDIHLL